ncbi:MAG: sulfatase-like hydrolase/transferase, partial [bacterium]|nr:sulfatase-like hydrolase/transferase [bacterium]
ESTLVAFTSDHGEEFLEHGRHFHGQSVYGELLRVPLVLWWPGVLPAGRVIDETVETLDLMPSLLDLSRLPLDAQLQGRSLVPLVTAAEGEAPVAWRPRPAIAEKAATDSTTHPVYAPPPRETESFAIIAGGWKLIHNRKRSAGRPEYELYDHRDDPLNLSDLASEHPEVVEKLVRQLDAWHQQALSRRLDPDAETADSLSREELERLRSLGYIR